MGIAKYLVNAKILVNFQLNFIKSVFIFLFKQFLLIAILNKFKNLMKGYLMF